MVVIGLVIIAYGSTRPERPKREKYHDTEAERLGSVLRTMMNNDTPERCVLIRAQRVLFDHIGDKAGPYLVLGFWVYNASVFNLEFDTHIDGHLVYEEQEILQPLEFLPGGLTKLPRTDALSLELRQFLLPNVAEDIIDKKGKRIQLKFYNIQVKLKVYKPDGEFLRTWNCPFPKEVTLQVPSDGTVGRTDT